MQNDAVPIRDYTVGDEEQFGKLPRCELSPKIFLADFSREGRHPLLRNRLRSGVKILHYNSVIFYRINNAGTKE